MGVCRISVDFLKQHPDFFSSYENFKGLLRFFFS